MVNGFTFCYQKEATGRGGKVRNFNLGVETVDVYHGIDWDRVARDKAPSK